MKQQEVFKKIGGIVAELNDQYQYLLNTGELSNDLELELMAANAQFLSGHIEILRKVNASLAKEAPVVAELPPAPVVELLPEVATPAPAVPEGKPEAGPSFFTPVAPVEDADTHVVEFEIPRRPEPEMISEVADEPKQIRHELSLEDIGDDWDEDEDEDEDVEETVTTQPVMAQPDKHEEPVPQPPTESIKPLVTEPEVTKPQPPLSEPIKVTVPEPVNLPTNAPEPITQENVAAVISEKQDSVLTPPHTVIAVPEEQVMTLNQRMSAQLNAGRMSDQLIGKPIADLKSAISLNDKLLYVKDLFNGYSLAYSEAIDILNRYKSIEEAQTFLSSSYAIKNNWADKQATADKFYELLKRRYASDQ